MVPRKKGRTVAAVAACVWVLASAAWPLAASAQERCGTCAFTDLPADIYVGAPFEARVTIDIPESCYQQYYRGGYLDWGDGDTDSLWVGSNIPVSHSYASVGDYPIRIFWYQDESSPMTNPTLVCSSTNTRVVPACAPDCTGVVAVQSGTTVAYEITAVPNPATCQSARVTSAGFTLDFDDGSPILQGLVYKEDNWRQVGHHEYPSTPQAYTWKLTAHHHGYLGDGAYGECTKTGTVTVGPVTPSLTFGNITFTGDQRSDGQDGSVTLSGNVNANGALSFSGPITLRRYAGTQNGTLATQGNLTVSLAWGPPETIFSGTGRSFEIEGVAGTLTPSPAPETFALKLAGLTLYATDPRIRPETGRVVIAPRIILGDSAYVPSITLPLATADILVALPPGGYPNILDTELVDGKLTPYHEILSLHLDHSASEKKLTGTAALRYPLLGSWGLASTLTVEDGCVNQFDYDLGDDLEAIILEESVPRYRVDGLNGSVEWYCGLPPPHNRPASFLKGNWYADGFPSTFAWLSEAEAEYLPPLHFTFQGGRLVLASSSNWVTLSNQCSIGLFKFGDQYRMVLFGRKSEARFEDLISGEFGYWRLFGINDSKLSFEGQSLSGTLTFKPYPCETAECKARKIALKKALGIPPNSPLGGSFPIKNWVGNDVAGGRWWQAGLNGDVSSGGTWVQVRIFLHPSGASVIPMSDQIAVPPAARNSRGADGSSAQPYILGSERLPATFSASGETSTPAISLSTPGGQTITPTTAGSFSGVSYLEDSSELTALFTVDAPEPGTWTLSQTGLPAEQVAFAAMAEQKPPTVTVTLSPLGGGRYQVTASVSPVAPETLVSLHYSRMSDGVPEGTVASDLPVTSGTVTAMWDTTELPSGTWYAFASVEYGTGVPVVAYAPQPVVLDDGTLLPPTNLQGSRTGETATLTFTPSASPTATAHTVRFTGEPSVPGFESAVPAPTPARLEIGGLDPQKTYRFWAVAMDDAGSTSAESAPLTLSPQTTPGDCDGTGTVSIGEVQKAINMFLGSLPPGCGVDASGDGIVSIGEVQKVINAFLGVVPGISVSVTPSTANVLPGGTQQFVAAVMGTTNTTVTWTVEEGSAGGTVSASGLYTAPATSGTFHVKATSQADPSKSGAATVTVSQAPACTLICTASADPTSGIAPLVVTFAATATPDNCSGPVTYAWTFGDGGSSSQQNPSHTYPAAGTFTWTMTASVGGQYCSKSGSITVTAGGQETPLTMGIAVAGSISGASPNATWNWYYADLASGSQTVDMDAYDLTGDIDLYVRTEQKPDLNQFTCRSWRLGVHPESCQVSISGPVRLWVGITNQASNQTLTYGLRAALPGTCALSCTGTAMPTGGLTVQFSGQGFGTGCVTPTFLWDFGDGGNSEEAEPSHTYAAPGTYNWNLYVHSSSEFCASGGMIAVP